MAIIAFRLGKVSDEEGEDWYYEEDEKEDSAETTGN